MFGETADTRNGFCDHCRGALFRADYSDGYLAPFEKSREEVEVLQNERELYRKELDDKYALLSMIGKTNESWKKVLDARLQKKKEKVNAEKEKISKPLHEFIVRVLKDEKLSDEEWELLVKYNDEVSKDLSYFDWEDAMDIDKVLGKRPKK